MAIEIKVPILPESITNAWVLDWFKEVGDAVSRDEILVEVETDKVVIEIPSPVDGVLTEIMVTAGETVLGDQVLARMESSKASSAPSSEDRVLTELTTGETALGDQVLARMVKSGKTSQDPSPIFNEPSYVWSLKREYKRLIANRAPERGGVGSDLSKIKIQFLDSGRPIEPHYSQCNLTDDEYSFLRRDYSFETSA